MGNFLLVIADVRYGRAGVRGEMKKSISVVRKLVIWSYQLFYGRPPEGFLAATKSDELPKGYPGAKKDKRKLLRASKGFIEDRSYLEAVKNKKATYSKVLSWAILLLLLVLALNYFWGTVGKGLVESTPSARWTIYGGMALGAFALLLSARRLMGRLMGLRKDGLSAEDNEEKRRERK
ncbi:MAG: hypothetical protein QXH08_03060 [Candidatus Hadarchaeales archaeon]